MRDTWGSFKGLHTWTNLSPYAYCTECFRTRNEVRTIKSLFRCLGSPYPLVDQCGKPE